MYYENVNVKMVKQGVIKKIRATCPCCSTEYDVDLRYDVRDGAATVCMETTTDFGYIPVIYMHCQVCGVHFRDRVTPMDLEETIEF